MFAQGGVDFSVGLIEANYLRVAPGDLVLGYEASPTKAIVALAKVAGPLVYEGGEPVDFPWCPWSESRTAQPGS
jgi:hypothetical protein